MSANMSEEEKGEKLKEQEKHLLTATKQRSHYTSQVQQAKAALDGQRFDTADKSSPPATAHYSFDFAQQIHFPHKPLQPGPIYFLTPRKCLIFGVCAEVIPQQSSKPLVNCHQKTLQRSAIKMKLFFVPVQQASTICLNFSMNKR